MIIRTISYQCWFANTTTA